MKSIRYMQAPPYVTVINSQYFLGKTRPLLGSPDSLDINKCNNYFNSNPLIATPFLLHGRNFLSFQSILTQNVLEIYRYLTVTENELVIIILSYIN